MSDFLLFSHDCDTLDMYFGKWWTSHRSKISLTPVSSRESKPLFPLPPTCYKHLFLAPLPAISFRSRLLFPLSPISSVPPTSYLPLLWTSLSSSRDSVSLLSAHSNLSMVSMILRTRSLRSSTRTRSRQEKRYYWLHFLTFSE